MLAVTSRRNYFRLLKARPAQVAKVKACGAHNLLSLKHYHTVSVKAFPESVWLRITAPQTRA